MNLIYAAGVTVYEIFVTAVLVLAWEVLLFLLQFEALNPVTDALTVSPGALWTVTLFLALCVSLGLDATQIYSAGKQDEIRSSPIYAVRVGANFCIWAGILFVLSFRNLGAMEMVLHDSLNVSIGRIAITLVETVISLLATALQKWK